MRRSPEGNAVDGGPEEILQLLWLLSEGPDVSGRVFGRELKDLGKERAMKRATCWTILGMALLQGGCGDGDRKPVRGEPDASAETACSDGKDNDGDGFADCDDLDCRAAAATACTLAPPLDRTVATTVAEGAAFLYTGKDPVQKGVDPKALEPRRTALLRGKVMDKAGAPLPGARVAVAGHPELGWTLTRADGVFDLAVNGGGRLTLSYTKDGYLSAQRTVSPAWQRYEPVPVVGLVEKSAAATALSADASTPQVASAEVTSDGDGQRQALVVFEPHTRAHAELPNGTTQELSTLSVRITEYPVERSGRPTRTARFAPGTLAGSAALNYSLEFTVDEAKALGALGVSFSKPMALYVENFLHLKPGAAVPVGYYNRSASEWEPGREGGVVVQVVGENDGVAELDLDGDGNADSEAELGEWGITHNELAELAERYVPGDSLLRVRVSHFSAWGLSWTVSPPLGSAVPFAPGTTRRLDEPSVRGPVLVERQVLGQNVSLAGTPFSLRYQTDRTTRFKDGFRTEIPVLGAELPEGLKEVAVFVHIAGQSFDQLFEPKANLTHTVDWDGRDAFGRTLQGKQFAKVEIAYIFDGTVRGSQIFGVPGEEVPMIDDAGVPETAIWQDFEIPVGAFDATGYQLGGFSLDALHAYDPATQTVYFGNGLERTAQNVALAISERAASTDLGTPDNIVVAPDGSLLVTDDQEHNTSASGRILKISPDDTVRVIAGPGAVGEAGGLFIRSAQGVAMANDGSVWFSDRLAKAIRRVHADGSVETMLGPSSENPVAQAELEALDGLAFGSRGELYIVSDDRVLRFEGGVLSTFAGGGDSAQNEIVATAAKLVVPSGLAATPDGTIFVSERGVVPSTGGEPTRGGHRVRKITPDGIIHAFAGTEEPGFSGDGGQASEAELNGPRGLTLAPDGSLYIADQGNDRIRRMTPDGIIQTVVGGGAAKLEPGQLAEGVHIEMPDGIAASSDGTLFIAASDAVFRVAPGLPELDLKESLIPASDGLTLYRFDARGKHQETIDAKTGVTLLAFQYDSRGLVEAVRDNNELVTRFERDSAGNLTRVLAPFGQQTKLTLDDALRITKVEDPLGRSADFRYESTLGLLGESVDPNQNRNVFEYDPSGRILSVTDPTGYREHYAFEGGFREGAVAVTTPEGRTTRYGFAAKSVDTLSRSLENPDKSSMRVDDRIASQHAVAADGSEVHTTMLADSFFGAQALNPADSSITTPSGRVLDVTFNRGKVFTDPKNALSVTSWEEAALVGSREYATLYSRRDRTLTTFSPGGRSSVTRYDERGRPIEVETPGLGSVRWEYDRQGRVTRRTRHAGDEQRVETFSYNDATGFLRRRSNARNESTEFEHDVVGRLLGLQRPDNQRVEWELDAMSNVLSLTVPGGKEHDFLYQGKTDLLVATIPPDVDGDTPSGMPIGEAHFHYDSADLELTRIERADGRDLTFDHDDHGRLETTTLGKNGPRLSYAYDSAGKLTSVNRSDSVRVDWTFDGPLWTSSTWTGAVDGSVRVEYDDDFLVSSLTVNNASTVHFAYDPDGFVASARGNGNTLSVERDPTTGLVTATDLGEVSASYGYNGFGELSRVSAAALGGGADFSQTLERDELGRVKRITEVVDGEEHELVFAYDAVGRLVETERDGTITEYRYDANGNRTAVLLDGIEVVAASYDDQDRLLSHGAFEFEQSATGDLVRRSDGQQALELAYDPLGNLLSASLSDGRTTRRIDYVVDGLGRRVARKVNDSFNRAWLYLDELRPISELDAAGIFTHFVYTSPVGAPDMMLRSGVPFRIVKDHLGSVRLVVNASTGKIAQRLTYDAFGRVLEDTNPGFQPFGFAGGLYDPETGLVRFGARDYDPETGRWAAKDPIGFAGGDANVYVYCHNDPLNHVDFDGKNPIIVVTIVLIGISISGDTEVEGSGSPELFMAGMAGLGVGGALMSRAATVRMLERALLEGTRIGTAARGMETGKRLLIATKVTELRFSQEAAVAAVRAAFENGLKLRTITLSLGKEIGVAGANLGPSQPIMVVATNGTVRSAVANVGVQGGRLVAKVLE